MSTSRRQIDGPCMFPDGETNRFGDLRCGRVSTYQQQGCRGDACYLSYSAAKQQAGRGVRYRVERSPGWRQGRFVSEAPIGWMEAAECRARGIAPSEFFGDWLTPAAEDACAACSVASDCLEWAIVHGEAGWWGGESERARRRLVRSRARRAVMPQS